MKCQCDDAASWTCNCRTRAELKAPRPARYAARRDSDGARCCHVHRSEASAARCVAQYGDGWRVEVDTGAPAK